MDTCTDCVHRVMLPDPGTAELSDYCTRHPPQVIGVATHQGVMILTQYPKIAKNWPSCGDHEGPEEDPQIVN